MILFATKKSRWTVNVANSTGDGNIYDDIQDAEEIADTENDRYEIPTNQRPLPVSL